MLPHADLKDQREKGSKIVIVRKQHVDVVVREFWLSILAEAKAAVYDIKATCQQICSELVRGTATTLLAV